MKFKTIVCGGTFDHFHKGHASFLRFILSLSHKIILGLTTKKYVRNKKLSNSIENYSVRKNAIEEFFRKENAQDRLEIEPIDNLFIPKKWEKLSIDAIVVSNDTQKGAKIINQDREKRGLSQLRIIVVPIISADSNQELSSFRIRNGKINREGKLYVNPLWLKKDLFLPEALRQEFKYPLGELIQEIERGDEQNLPFLITVGDATTKKFNERSVKQNISVVDFKIARQKKFSSFSELGFSGSEKIIVANNPPGHITFDLFNAIKEIFKSGFENRIILKVIGEEDLAVLPLILCSPLDTIIYYGQPNEGLVKVLVSEDTKDKTYGLVSKLKPIETHTRGY